MHIKISDEKQQISYHCGNKGLINESTGTTGSTSKKSPFSLYTHLIQNPNANTIVEEQHVYDLQVQKVVTNYLCWKYKKV